MLKNKTPIRIVASDHINGDLAILYLSDGTVVQVRLDDILELRRNVPREPHDSLGAGFPGLCS